MCTIGIASAEVKKDSQKLSDDDDFEREHDGPEPECVRFVLEQPADEIGPTFRAAYERMADAFQVDSECAEIARFGKWSRGKKGKPLCLYVVALVFGLQRFHDRERKPNAPHVAFPVPGVWVAGLLRKYGIRPDMTPGTLVRKVYGILAALETAGILRRESDYRYSEKLAREYTVWTCAELDAKPTEPLPVVEAKPETPVAEIAADVSKAATANGGDVECQLEYELGALRAHAALSAVGSARRCDFNRLAEDVRGCLFEVRRARHKAVDGIGCRPLTRRRRKDTALARCET
jgi:hypothetical protein